MEGSGTVEVCAQITRGSIDCDIRAILASTDEPKTGTSVGNHSLEMDSTYECLLVTLRPASTDIF